MDESCSRFQAVLRRFKRRFTNWLQSRYLPWHLAVLAMVLCAPSLSLGLQTDDLFHRAALINQPALPEMSRSPSELFVFFRGDSDATHEAIDRGLVPWWTSPELRLSFYRPLTGLTHWIDYQLWPESPALMHVHSLVWFGGLIALTGIFYRRVMGSAQIAGLAALLFAVDDAHNMPAVWIANRNAMIAMFFGVLALIAHDKWRRENWKLGALLAPFALLAGLLSGESAVATVGYLLGYALFLDRSSWVSRLRSLLPSVVVCASWWLIYKQMGHGTAGSAIYIDPGTESGRFACAVAERAPMLLCGQWLFTADLWAALSVEAGRIMWLTAVVLLVVISVVLTTLLRHSQGARLWTVGMMLAVLPCCAAFPADRLLMFVGLGGMGLLAQFLAAVSTNAHRLSPHGMWRWAVRMLWVGFVAVHLVLSPLLLTLKTNYIKRIGQSIERTAASLPSGPAVRNQVFIIVNTPTAFNAQYGFFTQSLAGREIPARMLSLASGVCPIEIHRQDDHTLVVRPQGGFFPVPGSACPGQEDDAAHFDLRYACAVFDGMFRDDRSMIRGQRIELTDVTVEIRSVTEDGRPAEAVFRFVRVLEDPSFRWLEWKDGVYVTFAIPGVGETITLPAVTLPPL